MLTVCLFLMTKMHTLVTPELAAKHVQVSVSMSTEACRALSLLGYCVAQEAV